MPVTPFRATAKNTVVEVDKTSMAVMPGIDHDASTEMEPEGWYSEICSSLDVLPKWRNAD